MATVYLAQDLKHGRPVALKVLSPELAASLGSARFLGEIQFMARLAHPNILPLLDSGEAAGLVYYTMPFVEGESLRARLIRDGRLPLHEALRITQETADALDYAHRHEIVHRDIKPENILLEDGHAVVADFGIARAINLAGDQRATTAGLILGTPAYMSPEQVFGQSDLDGRSDVYSLACVLFEMLTGSPPFVGPTAQAVIAQRYTGDPPQLRAVGADVPEAVEVAVSRALARTPADRFSTASEFADSLKDTAPRAPALARARRVIRAGRRPWTLGAAFLVLFLLAGGLLAVGLRRRHDHPGLDPKRVAVAVFANRTGDAALESVGIMAADWVIRGLTQTALVDVVDLGTVLVQGRLPNGELTEPRQLAKQNGAGIVVWGNYYRDADRLVVQTSVIDVTAGKVLQSLPPIHAPPIAPEKALEALQAQVMGAMAAVLDPRFTAWTSKSPRPPNFRAYESYIAGQSAYWSGRPAGESRRYFAEAVQQDSTFLTAAVWLAFVGANGAGCGLTDSVVAALAGQRAALTRFDRLTLDISAARCRNDWEGGYRLALEQAGLKPRSTYAVYTAGFFALTSGHWRISRELLASIDPERDLGWLPDTAKSIYWRDYAAVEHFLGDYRSELRQAERQIEQYPNRLAPRMLAARALAGLHRGADALAHVEVAVRLPDDPTVRVVGGMPAGLVAYLAAAELRVHGDSMTAKRAAQRGVDWFEADPAKRLEAGRYERYWYARSLLMLGRIDEAVAVTSLGAEADSNGVNYLGLLGVLAAMQGREADARAYDKRLSGAPAAPVFIGTQRARVALALGERERGLELLETTAKIGTIRTLLGSDMHADMLFDQVRGDPRFERINQPDR